MHTPSTLAAFLAAISTVDAAYQGFNYGATFRDNRGKTESDFQAEFEAAQNLAGTNGDFSSARLYTMIQAGTTNDPTSAIPAAISTRTSLLFGLWASAGQQVFNDELEALRRTIREYGDDLEGLVAGISVGSEDLYRSSAAADQAGNTLPGVDAPVLARYIQQVKDVIEGTSFADYPVGHVDTWTAWVNGSNTDIIEACDWIGFDGYAYFESTQDNDISNGKALFDRAVGLTRDAVGSKPIWITETGWPTTGETIGNGVPSVENAEKFWQDVGCPLFGETNTWWYTLRYSPAPSNDPDFGVIGAQLTETPLYDLSCDGVDTSPSSSETTTTTSTRTTAAPTETDDDDDDTPSTTTTVTATPDESDSTTAAPSETDGLPDPVPSDDGHSDDGHSDDGGDHTPSDTGVPVPVPPPASSSISTWVEESTSAVPSASATDGTEDPTQVDTASGMSLSAAFLAVMLAVAIF